MAADALALVKHVGPILIRAGAFTEAQFNDLVHQAEYAAPQAITHFSLIFAFGRKL